MNRELRWRIIVLQVVMIVIFGFGAGIAFWGSDFTNSQIKGQLEPQQIFMPKGPQLETTINEINEKHADLIPYIGALRKYEGQQVLTGDQAHTFAESYLGVHLRDIDNGKPYSVLSSEARAEKDPALKAEKDANVQTAFRGETLRSILNQAWAFSIFGTMALYAAIGLVVAALAVVAALVYELFFATKRTEEAVRNPSYAATRA
jgi:hypothetical protein